MYCNAQDLQEIPEKVLQLGDTNTDVIVTSDYTEIHAPSTNTTVTGMMEFKTVASPSGYIQFTGPENATEQTTVQIKNMKVWQTFNSTIDLNGVNLTIDSMTNDQYENTTKKTPTYQITNSSELMSQLTVTRSDYSHGNEKLQNVNRATISGNIQLVVKPVQLEDFPSNVPLSLYNKYDRLYLEGANTYTGGTIVEGLADVGDGYHNTTLHANGNSLGTGPLTLRNMATLMNAEGDQTFTNDIILDNGGALRVGDKNTMTIAGTIRGEGNLYLNYNEANGGNIILKGTNDFTGDTYLCGFLETTQTGSGEIYTVKIQNDEAFSDGTVIFNSTAGGRQYTVTLELDNPGGTRMIDNDINLNNEKVVLTKSDATKEAIIAGQFHGSSVSVLVSDDINFHIDMDNWDLPSDGEFLYLWDITGQLTFNTETTFSIYSEDMSKYEGKRIYLANTDKVTGGENIRVNTDHAKGDGDWEMGSDPQKGFYVTYKGHTPVDAPEPTSGLLMLFGLLLVFRRRK